MSVAFVVYQLCDKEQLAKVDLKLFLEKKREYDFNKKLFCILAQRGIDENSFLKHGLLKLIVVIVDENVQSVIAINEAKNKTYHKPFLLHL